MAAVFHCGNFPVFTGSKLERFWADNHIKLIPRFTLSHPEIL
jgi:hypothetical protein